MYLELIGPKVALNPYKFSLENSIKSCASIRRNRKLKTSVDVGNFANVINGFNIYPTHYSTTSITRSNSA